MVRKNGFLKLRFYETVSGLWWRPGSLKTTGGAGWLSTWGGAQPRFKSRPGPQTLAPFPKLSRGRLGWLVRV